MLTNRQNEVFRYIAAEIYSTGVPPSYREIAKKFGWASNSAAAGVIDCLIERGLLTKLPNQARTLALTEAGDKLARVGRPMIATDAERASISKLLERRPAPWAYSYSDNTVRDGNGEVIMGVACDEEPYAVGLISTVNVLSRIRA